MAKEDTPETKATESKNTESKTTETNTVTISRTWAYGLGGAFIILIALMVVVGVAGRHERVMQGMRPGGFHRGLSTGTRPRRFMMGGNGQGTVNSANQVSGVVTAVNGSSFTLAGFGSTTNVTTDSSTQYQGGNTVKVNDTVVALGTTTGGTLTATEVSINP